MFLMSCPCGLEDPVCVYEGREVTSGKLALQGGFGEMGLKFLRACRVCCTLAAPMSPVVWMEK